MSADWLGNTRTAASLNLVREQGIQQLRRIDQAWASTVHAFEGGTVDTVIAAMEAKHPNLTNLKTLHVEISRARDRADLVTDDKAGRYAVRAQPRPGGRGVHG